MSTYSFICPSRSGLRFYEQVGSASASGKSCCFFLLFQYSEIFCVNAFLYNCSILYIVLQLSGTTQEFFVEATEPGRDGTSRAKVKVTISDESSSPPTWENAPFDTVYIFENTTVGTIIKTVTATSSVLPDNRVTYAIVQGQRPKTNNPKMFDLENAENQRDGEVKVFDNLDYETTRQ